MAKTASNAQQLTFRKDESGAIAVIFALMLFVVLGILGLMIDGGRATHAATRAGMALDATALASARAAFEQGLTGGKLDAYAQEFFDANIWGVGGDPTTYENLRVTADAASGDVDVTVTTRVPTYFGGLFGVNEIAFDNASKVNYKVRDLEFGMALDVTGSMRGSKIQALRTAATDLVDILVVENNAARKTRIGFAPYGGSVNVGPYIDQVTDPLFPAPTSCVIERVDGDIYGNTLPGQLFGGDNNYFGSEATNTGSESGLPQDIDPFQGTKDNYKCIVNEIQPLTDKKSDLKSEISALVAQRGVYTGGHLGIQWAWNLVSEDWKAIWPNKSAPAKNDSSEVIKAVLYMTDGDNNTSYTHEHSDEYSQELCDAMEAEGIVVFTVGFQLNNSNATNLMASCASTPTGDITQTAFLADNSAELRAAFQKIANQLSTLRVAG